MAYMRGDWYVYSTGEHMMIYHDGESIAIPLEVFDQLVAMRWHNLTEEEQTKALQLAYDNNSGNFGAEGVARALGKPTAMDEIATYYRQKERQATDGE